MIVQVFLLFFLAGVGLPPQIPSEKQVRAEEKEDYFRKWLDQDVKYIISDEEKSVFEKLTTPEEKENFIEQFWFRRDTDPRTAANEFKEEHYRRIAYANERFQSGKPGWMTDRGRVYIIHGEPAYIERYPSGGSYTRKSYEGGGQTFAYPFEVWYYRFVEELGDTLELEFVDPSFSGEYRLALRPEEKDQLLYVPGTAPTIRELQRVDSGRVDRPYFNPGVENNAKLRSLHGYRAQDAPFARYARYALAQKAPKIRFDDLKQIVTTNISYHDLPVQVRSDMVQLNDSQVLAPVTVEVDNKELTFAKVNNLYRADANIYGLVRTLVGRIVAEFEDSVVAEYPEQHLERGRQIRSVYQKILVLDAGSRYRLDIVVRDKNSNRTALIQSALNVPRYDDKKLQSSSVILSRFTEPAPNESSSGDLFVLGDLKIIPNVTNVFHSDETLKAYLQLYNVSLDQTTLTPELEVRYSIRKGKEIFREFQDNTGDSIHYYSPSRLVLLREMNLKGLKAGTYEIDIEVSDRISDSRLRTKENFRIEDPATD